MVITATAPDINIADPKSASDSAFYFICYEPLIAYLQEREKVGTHAAHMVMLVQRLDYWLKNSSSGYLLQDGYKWIFNGYKEWAKQFFWLTPKQIGNLVRFLESIGWVVSERFYTLKREIGFVGGAPSTWQEDNQRKWYRLNYEKIFQDTGFDFLEDSTPDEEKQPKRKPRANVPGKTKQRPRKDNATSQKRQSSIDQINNPITHQKEDGCEKEKDLGGQQEKSTGVEDCQEGLEDFWGNSEPPKNSDLDLSSPAPLNNSSKIIKPDSPQVRPPRQQPKFKYPEGPWLTGNGYLNQDFVLDRAKLWRTGDTPKSKAFGAMPLEDVMGLVCSHYAKPDNHANLEIHWNSYVAKNQRYIGNVKQRIEGGIEIPQEEQQVILNKRPAVLAEPVESVYEPAVAMLPPSADKKLLPELPQLPENQVIEVKAEVLEPAQTAQIVDDGQDPNPYRVWTADRETRDFWEQVKPTQKPEKSTPTSEEKEAAKSEFEKLKAKLAQKKAQKRNLTPPSQVAESPTENLEIELEDYRKYLVSGIDALRETAIKWASETEGVELVKRNGEIVDIAIAIAAPQSVGEEPSPPEEEEFKPETKVWAFHVKSQEWVPARFLETELDPFGKFSNYLVRDKKGEKIKIFSREHLKLRE